MIKYICRNVANFLYRRLFFCRVISGEQEIINNMIRESGEDKVFRENAVSYKEIVIERAEDMRDTIQELQSINDGYVHIVDKFVYLYEAKEFDALDEFINEVVRRAKPLK